MPLTLVFECRVFKHRLRRGAPRLRKSVLSSTSSWRIGYSKQMAGTFETKCTKAYEGRLKIFNNLFTVPLSHTKDIRFELISQHCCETCVSVVLRLFVKLKFNRARVTNTRLPHASFTSTTTISVSLAPCVQRTASHAETKLKASRAEYSN